MILSLPSKLTQAFVVAFHPMRAALFLVPRFFRAPSTCIMQQFWLDVMISCSCVLAAFSRPVCFWNFCWLSLLSCIPSRCFHTSSKISLGCNLDFRKTIFPMYPNWPEYCNKNFAHRLVFPFLLPEIREVVFYSYMEWDGFVITNLEP